MIKFTFSKIWGIVLSSHFLGNVRPLVLSGQYLENRPKVKKVKNAEAEDEQIEEEEEEEEENKKLPQKN